MRVAIIGQQDFGAAVLAAFAARGDVVVAVFCAPESGRPDALRLAAEQARVPVHQFARLSDPAAAAALAEAGADLGVMAYVTQFVPQSLCAIPRHGMIQFHPSLLPAHRGASAMSWAIITGRTETGLSIFRPTDGLDEGPVLAQVRVPITPTDTLGSLYFEKIFPAGVQALLDTADAVLAGTAREQIQDEDAAGYEGILREAESRINWAAHVGATYDLIRGCNPAPGAWTMLDGRKLFLFDCRLRIARRFAEIKGRQVGEVVDVSAAGLTIHGQGGFIEVSRLRWADGRKIAAAEAGIAPGVILG